MERAAKAAAGGNDALNARHATDPETMRRVVESLRGQLAGVDPLSRHEHLELPAGTIEHRVCAWLRGAR
jgi:hypothetical protein